MRVKTRGLIRYMKKICEEDCRRPRKVQSVSSSSIVVTLPLCLKELGLRPGTYVRINVEDVVFDESGKIKEVLLKLVVVN